MDRPSKPASRIDIYDRSTGFLASLADLVDRQSSNEPAGGFNEMRRNMKGTIEWILHVV